MNGKLYLIPTPIAQSDSPFDYLPAMNGNIIASLNYFVVENVRTARRFISSLKMGMVIDTLQFEELSEHTDPQEVEKMISHIRSGNSCGLMSEAGVPGVADPGAILVAAAHRHNIEVIPLAGPSSILMSLMASGMNGQSFTFNGYLPVKGDEKMKKIKDLERAAATKGTTQIFIETPYRSDKMFQDLIKWLAPDRVLCVAANISAPNQFIKSKSVAAWKKAPEPPIKKIPTIFLIG